MAYWDYIQGKITSHPPKFVEAYPNWIELDCGCCGGLQWGRDEPMECTTCGGTGSLFLHIKSRAITGCISTPLAGSMSKKEVEKILAELREGK